ncbi:aminopeptidase N [Kribbella sp. VKM Ac-2527]|uniref:Aminopeptidase N n=1 Tax=Kribbella caucasensis TaxID=2512215 RepID=A0A4R6IYC4_9ACTN|nr:aminopeptidase N [Kribbella sp. VKM Ac-2527]TDO27820.1 aminopeptidase N [Kribbella sp. VKM Ac-2527]
MIASRLTEMEARQRSAQLTVHSYDVTLDLTDGEGRAAESTFRSRTVVAFSAEGGGTFIDVQPVSLDSVVLNGVALETTIRDGRLVLPGMAADNVLVVDGVFALANEQQGLERTVDPADGEVYFASLMFMAAAQRVFACFDQPDLKAPYTFHITAPSEWEVISNGSVATTEPAAGGAVTRHFTPTAPIPAYITAVLAGPYHRVTDTVEGPDGPIELGLACVRSAAPFLDAERCFRWTKAGFDLFHRMFGYPYPFGKYDQIFGTDAGIGGMENAGAVTLTGGMIFRSAVTDLEHEAVVYTILHELSHMWFGDLVTTAWWQDTWLNEAFATFAGYLAVAEGTEFADAWTTFAQHDKVMALAADQLPSTHPISADVPDLRTALSNFDDITYQKGAAVLRQLVAYVGEEPFEQALRAYFREHAFGNTTLADLLLALEKASGRDLGTWSTQWLQSAQVNTLRPEYEVDADGLLSNFAVVQTAVPEHPVLRDHRLTIGFYSGNERLVRTHQVKVDVSGERTDVGSLIGIPAPAVVIVNDEDLTYAKVRFDPASLAVISRRAGEVEDPLARAVVWTALWDMTRYGELPASTYVEVALAAAGSEEQLTILERLLKNLEYSLSHYLDPSAEAQQSVADTAWTALHETRPGSDHQKLWLRTFARLAGGTSKATELQSLYAGDVVPAGVELDFETRWLLVHSLAAYGLVDRAAIDAELAQDSNVIADLYAATGRALLPTAEAKAAAWELVTTPEGAQGGIKGATARGFWHPAQIELLRPYLAKYFESIDAFWATDDGGEQAWVSTKTLAPSVVDEEVVSRAEEWLALPDRPAMLRRTVEETVYEVRQALRIRRAGG